MAPFFVAWRRNCASCCGCCPIAVHASRHAVCAIDQPQAIVGRTGCCETRKGEFLPAAPAASGAAHVSSGDDCMCGCSAGRMHVLATCAARGAQVHQRKHSTPKRQSSAPSGHPDHSRKHPARPIALRRHEHRIPFAAPTVTPGRGVTAHGSSVRSHFACGARTVADSNRPRLSCFLGMT